MGGGYWFGFFFLSILHAGGKIIPKDATFLQMSLFCARLEQNLLVLTKVENILFVGRIMNSLTFFRFWVLPGGHCDYQLL